MNLTKGHFRTLCGEQNGSFGGETPLLNLFLARCNLQTTEVVRHYYNCTLQTTATVSLSIKGCYCRPMQSTVLDHWKKINLNLCLFIHVLSPCMVRMGSFFFIIGITG